MSHWCGYDRHDVTSLRLWERLGARPCSRHGDHGSRQRAGSTEAPRSGGGPRGPLVRRGDPAAPLILDRAYRAI